MSLRIVKMVILGVSLLAMAACSTTGRHGSGSDGYGNGDQSGVEASGAGGSDGFGGNGDEDGAGGRRAGGKNTYYFDYDSNAVHNEYKPSIYANANKLIANPQKKAIVQGHTDPRGSREYNVALGERRANAVADLMKSKGVGPSQVQVVSYGAERLAAPGHSEQDYQLDRRAVIVE